MRIVALKVPVVFFFAQCVMLEASVARNDPQLARSLREADLSVIDQQDNLGMTMLHRAVRCGNRELVQVLLEMGADVSAVDKYCRHPLSYAAGKGDAEMVRMLLNAGAQVEDRSRSPFTPLLRAAASGDVETCKVLFNAGADLTAVVFPEYNATYFAAKSGSVECMKYLRSHDLNIVSNFCITSKPSFS